MHHDNGEHGLRLHRVDVAATDQLQNLPWDELEFCQV
jgi:hypothetical protein